MSATLWVGSPDGRTRRCSPTATTGSCATAPTRTHGGRSQHRTIAKQGRAAGGEALHQAAARLATSTRRVTWPCSAARIPLRRGVPRQGSGACQRRLPRAPRGGRRRAARRPSSRRAARACASTPVTPSTTLLRCPLTSVATAGVPQAAASVMVSPHPSASDALLTSQAR